MQFHTPHFICWQDDTGSQHEFGTKQCASLSFDLAKSPLSYVIAPIQTITNIGPSQVTISDSRQDSQFKAWLRVSFVGHRKVAYCLTLLCCNRRRWLQIQIPWEVNPCVLRDLSYKCINQRSASWLCINSGKMSFWHHTA